MLIIMSEESIKKSDEVLTSSTNNIKFSYTRNFGNWLLQHNVNIIFSSYLWYIREEVDNKHFPLLLYYMC